MYRVLFVCLGNICRSPLAEGVFAHTVAQAGLSGSIDADSAGTAAYHVLEPPHRESQRVAQRYGVDISQLRGRQIARGDFETFDLILAMDRQNHRDLLALERSGQHHHKVRLFSEFIADAPGPDVPDPYYGGVDGFEEVYRLAASGAQGLLTFVQQQLASRGQQALRG